MATIIVERELEPGTEVATLQAAEDAVAWCLAQHRVRFLRSYVALDGARMVCVYDAPDAESVRATQRQAGLPVAHAFRADDLEPKERLSARPGFSTVLVERSFEAPVTRELVLAAFRAGAHCLMNHRASLLVSHLAEGGMRMVCVFEAPDAEAVRIANRQIGVPFARAWTASMHLAQTLA